MNRATVGRGSAVSEAVPPWLAAAGVAVCLLVIVGATWRDAGTAAHTFVDEQFYSYHARRAPLSEAPVPSYLYFKVFSATQACGDGSLSCARLLNALFFAAALPFLFLVGRRFASWRASAAVTVATAVGPFTLYTAQFMPEATYFFGLWVALWLVTGPWPRARLQALAVGVAVGLLALVKLHGIFLSPSFAVIVFLLAWRAGSAGRWREGLLAVGLFAVGFVTARLGVGVWLGGRAALDVLGRHYGDHASDGAVKTLSELALAASVVLWRHVMAVVVLFTVPVVSLLTLSPLSPSALPGARLDRVRVLQFIAFVLVLPLLAMVAIYSAKVAGLGPYELPDRLHMRYYNFLVPLLMLVAAAQFDHDAVSPRWFAPRRLVPALLVFGVSLWALVRGLAPVLPVSVDCPDLLILRGEPGWFLAGAIGGLLALVVCLPRPRVGGALSLFLVLPLMSVGEGVVATRDVTASRTPTTWDTAAEIAQRFLDEDARERVHIVTFDAAGGFRALLALDARDATVETLAEDAEVVRPSAPKDWLLLIGRYRVQGEHRVAIAGHGFTLVHFE